MERWILCGDPHISQQPVKRRHDSKENYLSSLSPPLKHAKYNHPKSESDLLVVPLCRNQRNMSNSRSMPPPSEAKRRRISRQVPSSLSDSNGGMASEYPSNFQSRALTATSEKYSVTTSRYRTKVLEPNGVWILNGCEGLPKALDVEVKRILDHSRDSPEPPESVALGWSQSFRSAENESEANLEQHVITTDLLPLAGYHDYLARNNKHPFTNLQALMPKRIIRENLVVIPSLTGPCPDIVYGYKIAGFSEAQRHAQYLPPVKDICEPSRNVYWPFLTVEIKTQATGGNHWVATNQCAGSGSACSKAVQTLFEKAALEREDPSAFSATFDGRSVDLYVHWIEGGVEFNLQRIRTYVVDRPEELIDFRKRARNILDWGLDKRYKEIQSALDAVLKAEVDKAIARKKRSMEPQNLVDGDSAVFGVQ